MINYKAGDIVLVRFPFADLIQTKKRPALVLQHVTYQKFVIAIVAMITSTVENHKAGSDISLLHWKESGLLHPSTLRLSKITTIESQIIEKKLGKLHKADLRSVKSGIKLLFEEWL